MNIEKELQSRSGNKCELCGAENDLKVYMVPPSAAQNESNSILACEVCLEQLENPQLVIANHWRCLSDSMWSQIPAVQVVAWRMLNRLRAEIWPADLLNMLYLDDETLTWAKATGEGELDDDAVIHVDSNGVVLQAGDTVTLIKDLNVKGATFTAKRGTAVRNISLVHDNPEHIEGKINGQQIVILTKYVKK